MNKNQLVETIEIQWDRLLLTLEVLENLEGINLNAQKDMIKK